jgi:hypothetical protein
MGAMCLLLIEYIAAKTGAKLQKNSDMNTEMLWECLKSGWMQMG